MLVWVYHDCSSRSVCLSVAYITNNSRTQRSSVPTVGRRFPTLDATRKPVSRSKGQRSGSPGPLMHTHTSCAISSAWQSLRTQTWYTDGGRRPASATGTMTSKVKGQSYKVTWSVWAVLAQWPINQKRIVVDSLYHQNWQEGRHRYSILFPELRKGRDETYRRCELMTLTFDCGDHSACRWCGSTYSIRTPTLKFLGLTLPYLS